MEGDWGSDPDGLPSLRDPPSRPPYPVWGPRLDIPYLPLPTQPRTPRTQVPESHSEVLSVSLTYPVVDPGQQYRRVARERVLHILRPLLQSRRRTSGEWFRRLVWGPSCAREDGSEVVDHTPSFPLRHQISVDWGGTNSKVRLVVDDPVLRGSCAPCRAGVRSVRMSDVSLGPRSGVHVGGTGHLTRGLGSFLDSG